MRMDAKLNMRALACHLFSALALMLAFEAAAQAPTPPRIGYCFGVGDPGHMWTRSFIEGLRKRGWEDGRNVRVVLMPLGSINNDDFGLTGSCQKYMADKNLDVLVILGHSDPQPKIPVVTKLGGVAGSALARSTTRNITGITVEIDTQLSAKRIALLKEAVGAERVMGLFALPPGPNVTPGVAPVEEVSAEMREVARKLGIEIRRVNITKREDVEPAFKAMAAKPRTAVVFYDGPAWGKDGVGIDYTLARLKYRKQLPFMGTLAHHVMGRPAIPEAPFIIAYGYDTLDEIDRYAYLVDRILRGAKPADLPFEQTPLRLAINVEAAKKLGITFPQSILMQADSMVPHHPQFDWTATPQPIPPEIEERVRAILQSE
jgi:putative ABC transport system substrate-binding protein